MVPKSMQQELWAVYVPGQEIRKDPTKEYMEVAFKIIEHVEEKEGITHG